jgi:hypothetical protein
MGFILRVVATFLKVFVLTLGVLVFLPVAILAWAEGRRVR